MRAERWNVSIFVFVGALMYSSSASAQTASKWEVEFHGGWLLSASSTGGTVNLPPPGQVFTVALAATPPPDSRRVSSWYFGDGAILFNDAVQALGQLPGRIRPLDAVLGGPLGDRSHGGSFGARVSRALTPRLAVEFSVDYGFEPLRIADESRAAIEATRASFIPAFTGMITFNPNRVLTSVTSTAAIENRNARQLITSGVVLINFNAIGSFVPYATIGAGLISRIGETPTAQLRGNYQFRLGGGFPVNETDTVTVTDARDRHAPAGILGGGVKYHLSSRIGLRFDARVSISKASAETAIDTDPVVTLGLTPAGRGALAGNPSLQFSNTTDVVTAVGVTAAGTSSLSGPGLTGFRTFSGSGVASDTNVTVGLFWRF